MRKKVWLFALAAVLLVILAGCRGNELPDGMDEDKVSSAGLAVMSQLTKGEYEGSTTRCARTCASRRAPMISKR